jgi:hypothetical protein
MKPPREERLAKIKRAIDSGSDLELTDAMVREKLELMATISLLTNPMMTQASVVKRLESEHGLSYSAAMRRVRDAKEMCAGLWSGTDRTYAKFQAKARAEAILEKAMQEDDLENALKANAQLIALDQLDKEDSSLVDPTKLEPHEYRLMLSPQDKRLLRKTLSEGVVDLSELFKGAPDAEFEETAGDEEEEEEDDG